MKNVKTRIISIGGSAVVGIFCAFFGSDIEFKDQWPLFEALRSTSSIIFAVIGAWLTILYPEAIKKVFSRHVDFDKSGVADIELMVSNIRYSTAILAIILAVGIGAQILKHVKWALDYIELFRSLSFGLLGALTFLQFWSLLMTLAQAEMAKEKVSTEASRKDGVKKFNSNVQSMDEKKQK